MRTIRTAIIACAASIAVFAGVFSAEAADTETLPEDKVPVQDTRGPSDPAPPGFSSWRALFAEQDRLNAAAARIASVGEEQDGFAGFIADPDKHVLQVYWKGVVPAAVQEAVAKSRTETPVEVIEASYSLKQLSGEVDQWIQTGKVSSAAPAPDGSGIRLTVAGNQKAADLPRPAGATAPISVENNAPMSTAVADPVPLEDAAASSPWRWRDSSPFYAGGKINPGGCTSGFSVWDVNGKRGMLTAAHCGKAGVPGVGSHVTNFFGDHMGWFDSELENRDIAIVHANSWGRMYTGAWNSSTSIPVVGMWKTWPGNYVCNSGSTTGENCSIKATDHGVSMTLDGQYVKHLIRAKHTQGGCAVAKGDSGGPIFSYSWPNGSGPAALAQGVTSGGSGSVYCASAGKYGFPTIYFARVTDSLLAFQATLKMY